jgi:hypothetical protein
MTVNKRYVPFLVACVLWPVFAIVADINDVNEIGALSFLGMTIAGIYVGIDLFLAPATSLIFLLSKELFPGWTHLVMIRLVGLMCILMSLTIFVLHVRVG